MHELFACLRERWLVPEEGPKRSAVELSRHLDVRPQRISQWATGSDAGHTPPWWVILKLCEDTNQEIKMNAEEIRVCPRRRGPKPNGDVIIAAESK